MHHQFNSIQSLSHVRLLWPHGLQHASPPCPSPTPGVYSNSYPLSRWCHPAISSSVIPFSSFPQSFPASGSFQMSQLFIPGGQSIRVSASTSFLPMNIQDWSPLGWTAWISLRSKGLSRVFSNTTVQKHQFFGSQLLYLYKLHWGRRERRYIMCPGMLWLKLYVHMLWNLDSQKHASDTWKLPVILPLLWRWRLKFLHEAKIMLFFREKYT